MYVHSLKAGYPLPDKRDPRKIPCKNGTDTVNYREGSLSCDRMFVSATEKEASTEVRCDSLITFITTKILNNEKSSS